MHHRYLLSSKINVRLHFLQKFHAQDQWDFTIQYLESTNEVVASKDHSDLNNTDSFNYFTVCQSNFGIRITGLNNKITLLSKL